MLDTDPRLALSDALEPNLHLGVKIQWEVRLPPGETSRAGGSQAVILPISKTLPLARVSVSRPPSPGSNASNPGARGVVWNRPFGRHQVPISCTKAAKARSGAAFTRKAT